MVQAGIGFAEICRLAARLLQTLRSNLQLLPNQNIWTCCFAIALALGVLSGTGLVPAWVRGVVQQLWGWVGVPAWRRLFEAVARLFGRAAFPDQIAFGSAIAVA